MRVRQTQSDGKHGRASLFLFAPPLSLAHVCLWWFSSSSSSPLIE